MHDMQALQLGRLSARLVLRAPGPAGGAAAAAAAAGRLTAALRASPPAMAWGPERASTRLRHLSSVLQPQAGAGAAAAPAAASTQPAALDAPDAHGYRLPPQEILEIVDMPSEPMLSFSPDRKLVLQLARPSPMPPISELAKPELKLAGGGGCQVGWWGVGWVGTLGTNIAPHPPSYPPPPTHTQACASTPRPGPAPACPTTSPSP